MSEPRAAGLSETAAPFAPPAKPRGWRRLARWVGRLLAVLGALVLILLLTPVTSWIYAAMDRQDPLSKADYIICLGGDPYRVLEATQLLKENYAPKLIVSNIGPAAERMKQLALEWGAPGDRLLVDYGSQATVDHPRSIMNSLGVAPATDRCIVVTSYSHLARSKACFHKAGYKHLIMREPRWERSQRKPEGITSRLWVLPQLLYECAAWVEYWLRGFV